MFDRETLKQKIGEVQAIFPEAHVYVGLAQEKLGYRVAFDNRYPTPQEQSIKSINDVPVYVYYRGDIVAYNK